MEIFSPEGRWYNKKAIWKIRRIFLSVFFLRSDQGSGSQLLLKVVVFSIVRSYPAELSTAGFMVRISTSYLCGKQDIFR